MAKLMSSAIASVLGNFDAVISEHFDHIDLSTMMVYLVDCVSSDALPWLAEQFDVEGYKGYDRCTTDKQRRELIKKSISLHYCIGTISAVQKACDIIGFTPKSIEENVPLTENGENVWCAFRIRLSPEDLSSFSSDTISLLKQYISYYKNARSILTEVFFDVDFDDSIFLTEEGLRDALSIVGNIDTIGDYSFDYGYDFY